ncbi:MAG TPA: molybdopterin molybdenumtransferase MoeA [Chloroflexi bacterium]|nr:molybdopterin molybdenumtransferase MoeA [Chloroflexota bacterium]HHW88556.1 molybdopterin molybdotransferase MoeA [Chloroflexota bacterium]
MTELFTVHTPPAAWARFVEHFQPTVRTEQIATAEALERILAAPLTAPQNLPEFARATVDGYAVAAADTYGATPGLPAFLTLAGEVPMGKAAAFALDPGQAALVHTGGMIPPGADAVVMIEDTQRVADNIEVFRPVAEGQNVVQVGEDIRRGQPILAVGHRLRPQDLGGLLALGITEVVVAAPPIVGIISTGDEVVAPDQPVQPGQVRDINSYTLAGLAVRAGGRAIRYGIVPDDRTALEAVAARAVQECDIVVFSAGSSVSYRDMTAEVIDGLGKPGVLVHGVSVKPGKPTILAVCDGKAVFGLPGNPVSAMVIFDLFITPAIGLLLGAQKLPQRTVMARLARNLASDSGREDYVQVRLETREGELWAVPVLGKSNLIYTLVNAEGTIKVPLDANGLRAGEWVTVVMH